MLRRQVDRAELINCPVLYNSQTGLRDFSEYMATDCQEVLIDLGLSQQISLYSPVKIIAQALPDHRSRN